MHSTWTHYGTHKTYFPIRLDTHKHTHTHKMISTQMAVNINCTFKTEFCMCKVNKSEISVIMAITNHPGQASKE